MEVSEGLFSRRFIIAMGGLQGDCEPSFFKYPAETTGVGRFVFVRVDDGCCCVLHGVYVFRWLFFFGRMMDVYALKMGRRSAVPQRLGGHRSEGVRGLPCPGCHVPQARSVSPASAAACGSSELRSF